MAKHVATGTIFTRKVTG